MFQLENINWNLHQNYSFGDNTAGIDNSKMWVGMLHQFDEFI